MLHLGPHTFDELSGEVVQNTAFVITNSKPTQDTYGAYYRLIAGGNCHTKETMFLEPEEIDDEIAEDRQVYFPNMLQSNFEKIPGCPIAYWVSENCYSILEYAILSDITRNLALVCKLATTIDSCVYGMKFQLNRLL